MLDYFATSNNSAATAVALAFKIIVTASVFAPIAVDGSVSSFEKVATISVDVPIATADPAVIVADGHIYSFWHYSKKD